MNEELKKAAKDYCRKMEVSSIISRDLDFIAGAEWQYQKDRLEFAKLKAKEWQDGFNAGVESKEQQMMAKDKVKIDRKVLFEICDAILSHDGYADRDNCPENESDCFWAYWDKDFLKKVENIRKNS